jgi:hypothetical protein
MMTIERGSDRHRLDEAEERHAVVDSCGVTYAYIECQVVKV